ncbi:AmmeMemoRadiSam system protein A [Candidatus Woesearchaeota archaeon]|nr:AmmeMemoRadiSam system protein A [Candidatus Woesearchaeota archaeon]
MTSESSRKYLLRLARESIEKYPQRPDASDAPKDTMNKKGIFVTLHKYGELRGCIGNIMPVSSAYVATIENARFAAYADPRFSPVSQDEFSDIKIEISLLSVPKRLNYSGRENLLSKLDSSYGIIIKKNENIATFLPQVWEELPDKAEFLSQLCLKAGLARNDWEKGAEIKVYKVESFSE